MVVFAHIQRYPVQVKFIECKPKNHVHGICAVTLAPILPFTNADPHRGITVTPMHAIQFNKTDRFFGFQCADQEQELILILFLQIFFEPFLILLLRPLANRTGVQHT